MIPDDKSVASSAMAAETLDHLESTQASVYKLISDGLNCFEKFSCIADARLQTLQAPT